jgi:rubrerythrin
MKTPLFISLSLLVLAGISGFTGATDKTISNLQEAFKGESNASAKYAAYADQARKDGFPQISAMFAATSKAEAIHAENHKKVLEKMGQKVEPFKPQFTVKSTKENLDDAIKGETFEMTTMYPGYIVTAKTENAANAVKSFRWAMDTEKKHQLMYQKTLAALNGKLTNTLPKVYWVCPKCGNTYDELKPESSCSFCSTGRDKYIKFDH